MTLKPVAGHVLLLDDQEEQVEGGVVVLRTRGTPHLDFLVVDPGGAEGFGAGDRVVVSGPGAGRRVRIDGVLYREVKAGDVVAVCER